MSESAKPPADVTSFCEWASDTWDEDLPAYARLYEMSAGAARSAIQGSEFYSALPDALSQFSEQMADEVGQPFLMHGQGDPALHMKPFSSVLDKALRVNILDNPTFPDPPTDAGWLRPSGWLRAFDDIVRGQVICRFVDGPKQVASHVADLAHAEGLEAEVVSRQHERGYYAHHLYVTLPVPLIELKRPPEDVAEIPFTFELQFATQLQDIMYSLTHTFYEAERLGKLDPSEEWKWETNSARFRAAYLSHTLHLLEAIIVDVRDDPDLRGDSDQ